MKIICLFLLLFIQQPDSIQQVEQTTVEPEKIEQTNSGLSESQAYKLLYENEKNTNDRLISITQWTLGLSISIILAIIFSQIFFNYRINKREIDNINDNLEKKLQTHKTEIQKDLKSSFDSLKSENAELIKDKFSREKDLLEIEGKLMSAEFNSKINQIEMELEKNTGDIWVLKGIEVNAISSFVRSAMLQVELKHDPQYILDDIIEVLEKTDELSQYTLDNLNELLKTLGTQYPKKQQKIKENVKDKPIYVLEKGAGFGSLLDLINDRPGRVKYVKNKPKS